MAKIRDWRERQDVRKKGVKGHKHPKHTPDHAQQHPAPSLPRSTHVADLRVDEDLSLSLFDDLNPDQDWVINPTGVTEGDVLIAVAPETDGEPPSWTTATPGVTLPTTDGIAPTSSPTPVCMGGPGYIAVKWEGVANSDLVTYEIHISETTGFTADSTTLVGESKGTLFFIRQMPDDTSLAYDMTYFVVLVAKDDDGAAAQSAEAPGIMVQVQQGELAIDSVTAENILAGNVTAEHLQSVLLLSSLIKTAESGQRIEIDTDGIRAYDPDDQLTVSVPSGSGSPFFRGTLEATGLDITGNAVLSGQFLTLNQDTELALSSALSDPVNPPTVVTEWEEFEFDSLLTTQNRKGFTYVPLGTDNEDTPTWLTVGYKAGGTIYEIDATTRTRVRTIQMNAADTPLTAFKRGSGAGARLWVTVLHWNGSEHEVRMKRYDWADWDDLIGTSASLFETDITGGHFQIDGSGIMTLNGNEFLVLLRNSGTQLSMRFHAWTGTNPDTASTNFNTGVTGEHRFLVDLGGGVFYTCQGSGDLGTVMGWSMSPFVDGGGAPSGTPTRDSDRDFLGAADGTGFDGTNYWSPYRMLPSIRKHTDLYWAGDTTKNVHFQYTWFGDEDANGRDAGDFESAHSPTGTVAAMKRARIGVTIPTPPNNTDVTHLGVYAQLNATATDIEFQEDIAEDYPNAITVYYEDIATGGANPPTSSTFESTGTPGLVSFGDGDPVLVGDKRLIMPSHSDGTRDALTSPETGLILYNTTRNTQEVWSAAGVWRPMVTGKNAGEVWRLEYMTGTKDLANINAHSANTESVTVTGALIGDIVIFLEKVGISRGLLIRAEPLVTVNNAIELHIFNTDTNPIDAASATFHFLVFHRS